MNAAVAGDESVAIDHLLVHSEIGAAMPHQLFRLFESTFVEQQLDAFARRKLALFVLPRVPLLAAARFGISVTAAHLRRTDPWTYEIVDRS